MSLSKLHVAAGSGDLGTLKLFLTDDDVDQLGKIGRTLLHTAAQKGQTAVVQALLSRNAARDLRDKHGRTPLHVAAHSGHERTAAELCEAGAELEAQTASGRTPLHLAAWAGKAGVCAVLVNQGAKLQAKDQGGKTALHLAAWSGQLGVVEQLLRLGAEVEVEDESGRTPLLVAAKFGHGDIVNALLLHGADITATDHKGSSAGALATAGGFTAVKEVLNAFAEESKMERQAAGEATSTENSGVAKGGKTGAASKAMQLSGRQPSGRTQCAVGSKKAPLPKGKKDCGAGEALSQTHLAVHVDMTQARTVRSTDLQSTKQLTGKTPARRQSAPHSTSSLDTTVDELALGLGAQGSVAFGRSEMQKDASKGLMLCNPVYITDVHDDCSLFADANSSSCVSGLDGKLVGSGCNADADASRSGWSDQSIDEILQEMAAEPHPQHAPTHYAPADPQHVLEIPDDMAALCASRRSSAADEETARKLATTAEGQQLDGWGSGWEDIDVEEILAAVDEAQEAGGKIQQLSTKPQPLADETTTASEQSVNCSVRSSSGRSGKSVASSGSKVSGGGKKKKTVKAAKKAGAMEVGKKTATPRQAASEGETLKALRRRAEDAEAVAAQTGRALERVSELKAAGGKHTASDSQHASDKRALHCEMDSLQMRLEASHQQKARLEKELSLVKESLAAMEKNMTKRLSQLSEEQAAQQAKNASVEQLKRRLAESDAARATLERHLAEEAAAKDAARNRLAAVERAARDAELAGVDVNKLREQLKAAEAQRDATLAAVEARGKMAGAGNASSELEMLMELEEMRIRAEAAENEVTTLRDGLSSSARAASEAELLRADIARDQQVKGRMDAEAAELAKLKTEYERQREAMKAQLTSLRGQVNSLEKLKASLMRAEKERGELDGAVEALVDETAKLTNASRRDIRARVTGQRALGVATAAASSASLQEALEEISQLRAELAAGRELRWELEQESKALQDKLQAMDESLGGKVPGLVALRRKAADFESRALAAEEALAEVQQELALRCPPGAPSREQLAEELADATSRLTAAEAAATRLETAQTEADRLRAELQSATEATAAAERRSVDAEARTAEQREKVTELEAVLRSHVSGADEARRAAEAELSALRASTVDAQAHGEAVDELNDAKARLSKLETRLWTLAGTVPAGGEDEAVALEGALGELEAQQAELLSLRHTARDRLDSGEQSSELRDQLTAALDRATRAEEMSAEVPKLQQQIVAGQQERQALEVKLARFDKQAAELEGWKAKSEAAELTVRKLKVDISRLRAGSAHSHAHDSESGLLLDLEATLSELSEKSESCAELEGKIGQLEARCEAAERSAEKFRSDAESERATTRQRLEAAQAEVEALKQELKQTQAAAGKVDTLERALESMREYAEQLRGWAEHGRTLEEQRATHSAELAEWRRRAEDAEAVFGSVASRLDGADDREVLSELRRALAVAHRDRQTLEARLSATETTSGDGTSVGVASVPSQATSEGSLGEQVRYLQARLASVQEDADRRCESAEMARAQAESAVREMACGLEHMLERGLAEPGTRRTWPERLRKLVVSFEARAMSRAASVDVRVDAEELAAELTAAKQAAAEAVKEREGVMNRLRAAEERSGRLEAEMAAQEASLRSAAESAEEQWRRRLEVVQREAAAAMERASGRTACEERDEAANKQKLKEAQAELQRFKERARALLEEKDAQIAAFKAQRPSAAVVTPKPGQQLSSSKGSESPSPSRRAQYLQQVIGAGLASGALQVAPTLRSVLSQLLAQEAGTLEAGYFAGVLAKGLQSGDIDAEPSLADALARLLHLDPDLLPCKTQRDSGLFGGIFG